MYSGDTEMHEGSWSGLLVAILCATEPVQPEHGGTPAPTLPKTLLNAVLLAQKLSQTSRQRSRQLLPG